MGKIVLNFIFIISGNVAFGELPSAKTIKKCNQPGYKSADVNECGGGVKKGLTIGSVRVVDDALGSVAEYVPKLDGVEKAHEGQGSGDRRSNKSDGGTAVED